MSIKAVAAVAAALPLQLPDAEQLPASVDWSSFSSLRHLDLSHCTNLQQLPVAICSIPTLQSLTLGGQHEGDQACVQLTALPESISGLTALQDLNLCDCRSLTKLPDALGSLPALQQLNLGGCSLRQLPDSVCNLQSLQELDLHASALQQLPDSFGRLAALQHLNLSDCCFLQQLPESLGSLGQLRVLDLRGCRTLQELPMQLGSCTCLERLQLACCFSLRSLPPSIGACRKLQELSVQGCCSLQQLPNTCRNLTALQRFDFEGCPACAGLQESCTSHAPMQEPATQDSPAGKPQHGCGTGSSWARWPWQSRQQAAQRSGGSGRGYQLLRSALQIEKQRAAVAKLATQQEPMLSTLERMSWLVVLLATATFVAFTMPPGGYGDNQQVLSSNTGACSAAAELGVDANGISNATFQQCAMLLFFVFDGLSFGLSLGCVMMIVVLSMPRIQWESEKAEAGRFYLLLSVTWFLLYAAVATGFASFIAAGLSVNRQVKVVIGPVVPGMLLLVVGGVLLCYRFWRLAPGWDAVWASLSFHNQEVRDACEVEKGQELFWRYWGQLLSRNRQGARPFSESAAGFGFDENDVELQRLLPAANAPAYLTVPQGTGVSSDHQCFHSRAQQPQHGHHMHGLAPQHIASGDTSGP